MSRSGPTLKRGEQDADAEIEAVHHDIGEDGEGDDDGPDGGQVDIMVSASRRCRCAAARPGVMPALRIGPLGSVGARSPACGGLRHQLAAYTRCPCRTPRNRRPRRRAASAATAGASSGRRAIGGAQQAIDRPGLAPDFGGHPAGDHRDEARRPHRPPRRGAASASRRACRAAARAGSTGRARASRSRARP